MIEFITSVPWWGWLMALVWFFAFVFKMQMEYIDNMTPDQKSEWMEKQGNKKPWYMGD